MAAGAKDPVVLYVSGGNTQVGLPEFMQARCMHDMVVPYVKYVCIGETASVSALPGPPTHAGDQKGGLSNDLPGKGST